MNQKEFDLTIFSVATDRYIKYWSAMVDSYFKTNRHSVKIQWIVFTDKSEEIDPILIDKLGKSLLVSKISHQKWPLPTILRYQFLSSISNQVFGRIVMHLDADMLFVGEIDFAKLEDSLGQKGVLLVRHPGYFRPTGREKLKFYLMWPRYLLKDFKTCFRFGGLGTWESNKESRAFVPRSKRKDYVCGGIWLGRRQEIITLCEELSRRVSMDFDHKIVAVFHDESHLNWYQIKNQFNLLNPELCFDPGYPQLRNLTPKILAVDKNAHEKWIR